MRRIFPTLALFLIPGVLLAGYNKPGSTSGQFLRIGISARAVGMGEAFVAVADDASAIFYNPAGLVNIRARDLMLTHIEWPAGINYEFGGLVWRVSSNSAIGLSFSNLYTDEMRVRTPLRPEGTGETFYSSNYTLALSYAQYLTDRFSFGVNLRYLRLSLMTGIFTEDTWAVDVGALYQTGFRRFNIGIAIRSFGPNVRFVNESYALPTNFTLGVTADLLESDEHRVTTGVEWAKPAATEEVANLGVEYVFKDMLALRGGYKINYDAESWSLGVGVILPVANLRVRVDYAYSDFGFLNCTQRFSLGIAF